MAGVWDEIVFGQPSSERRHGFSDKATEIVRGGMEEPARVLLPVPGERVEGGNMTFTMKIDPDRQNYFTARFWGSDSGNSNLLILFCEGKQVGYRHLGDYDVLDIANEDLPRPGHFTYTTVPLPFSFSDKIKGKQIFSLIIAVVIFFSNWFPTGTCSEWSVSEEEEFVLNVTPPPEDCEIMYLTDKGSTSDVIDAELQMDSWTIAQYFHIDTLNGYSGQEPQGWNVRVKDVKAAEEAEKWLRKNNIYDRNVYAYDIGSKEWTKLNYEE